MVVALVALFVALGGSGYAAIRVGSREIVDNSVRSEDLRENGVRGRDVRNSTIRARDILDGSLTGSELRPDSVTGAAIAGLTGADVADESLTGDEIADLETSEGVVKLDPGQSAALFERGPFTISATCRAEADQTTAEVTVTDSEGGSAFFSQTGSAPLTAGEPRQIVNADGETPETGATSFLLASASGTTVAGYAGAGVNQLGSPCFFLATGLGGTGVK
jgi:hypothetical protein